MRLNSNRAPADKLSDGGTDETNQEFLPVREPVPNDRRLQRILFGRIDPTLRGEQKTNDGSGDGERTANGGFFRRMASILSKGNGKLHVLPANEIARQRTLKERISCAGIGLHSGAKVALSLVPADPDTGIVFRRTDRPGSDDIPARWDNVVDTRLNTTLGAADGTVVGTVEHLLSALAGAGIDNAVVEIGGPEVPAMDGSAEPFVFLIECAGTTLQDAPRRMIEILKPVSVGDHAKSATLQPASGFSVSLEIDFENPVIARQRYYFDFEDGSYGREIARARTFGFEHEVEAMRKMGLAKGGSLDNAVVIGGDRVLNRDGLRFHDEFVKHKVLDAIGDLYLAGQAIRGHYHGFKSGHALNNDLLRALFADRSAWRLAALSDLAEAAEDYPRVAASA